MTIGKLTVCYENTSFKYIFVARQSVAYLEESDKNDKKQLIHAHSIVLV